MNTWWGHIREAMTVSGWISLVRKLYRRQSSAVRVDASGREGWWYEGGGIYRHVALEICDTVSIAPWGVFISPLWT